MADWRPEDTLTALRLLARLHAAFLGEAPGVLPRPFTRDLESTLGVVPAGVQALRARYAELPHLPRIAGERALALLLELARCPDALRGPLARSPETLLHGDYHRANLAARDGEEPVIFDWQFVGAGPPACDLAVFWLYLGAVNRRGLFGLDRAAVRARSLTWAQVLDVYGGALRALRPDADIDAIASCADAAIVCETVRGIGYLGPAMEPFIGLLRFAYRDHPMLARPLVRYLGLDQGLRLGAEIFADFEGRAARLLDGRRSSG